MVAGVLLNKSKAQNSGWIVITWAWGMAVFIGVLVSVAVNGGVAHLNPAVTIGFWAAGALTGWTTTQVPVTIACEFIGAMIGAVIVYLAYLAHWSETEDPGLKLAVFCTGPAIRNTAANLITEIIGTFMLVFGVDGDRLQAGRRPLRPRRGDGRLHDDRWRARDRRPSRRLAGLGDRSVPGWADRLRDQPGP